MRYISFDPGQWHGPLATTRTIYVYERKEKTSGHMHYLVREGNFSHQLGRENYLSNCNIDGHTSYHETDAIKSKSETKISKPTN